jgi:hypothetical protein
MTANFGNVVLGNTYILSSVVYAPSPVCASSPTPITQPPAVTQQATLCTPTMSCPSGACLAPDQLGALCIMKAGQNSCPQGYPNSTAIAANYADSRSCGACTCGSSLTCAFNGVGIYNDSACASGGPYFMNATGSCTAGPSNYPVNAVLADGTSAGSPACAETTPSSPTGSVTLNAQNSGTVCCK